jgi:hypothetical protein
MKSNQMEKGGQSVHENLGRLFVYLLFLPISGKLVYKELELE